ncbi:DMT family transporter [Orrella sp. JC864]|uniref:DMT family transporter n=1 Tax=Orrella sp. JC864 TaxID=3120298 RepID=UPI00300AF4F9
MSACLAPAPSMPRLPIPHSPAAAILTLIVATLCLASHDTLAKYLAQGYPVPLLIWARYLVHLCAMSAIVAPRMGAAALRSSALGLHFLRAVCLVGIAYCFMNGLRYVPLAESTAMVFLAPLFVLVISRLFYREQVRPVQWLAVAAGLAGVLLIVRPGGALWTPAILLPGSCGVFFAVYQLLTRATGAVDGAAKSNFLVGLFGTALASVMLPFFWQTPDAAGWAWMIALGLLGMMGHMLLASAFKQASPVLLAPFGYFQIVFAVLLGYLVYDQHPDAWALLGMGMIALGGMATVRAQQRRRRAERAAAQG